MRRSAAYACILFLAPSPTPASANCSDVAIVLAIDSSGSIDAGEFALQAEAYGAAFRDPSVRRAIAQAGDVDVAAVFWADPSSDPRVVPWHRVGDPTAAEEFAAEMEASRRTIGGDTGLGQGVFAALRLFREHLGCTSRLIINVSGDGRASIGANRHGARVLAAARGAALDAGVVINGLAGLLMSPKAVRSVVYEELFSINSFNISHLHAYHAC